MKKKVILYWCSSSTWQQINGEANEWTTVIRCIQVGENPSRWTCCL